MIDYDPHHWRTTFFAIRGTMLGVTTKRSVIVTLLATPLVLLHFYWQPFTFTNPTALHGFIGTALGLLLVFRTNQSYDRWWEGRKLWGAMVNTCRNLARAATVHLEGERLERIIKLDQAFPAASMVTLRRETWTPENLHDEDAKFVASKNHAPSAICQRITFYLLEELKAGRISDIVFTQLDNNNQLLVDIIGGCERIDKTPLPFAYVVHLRRALVLYCATLPLALVASIGWWSLVAVFAVTYVLLGIEEIGVEIEDPFDGDENDLPLERITATIQSNVGSLGERS